MTSKISGEEFVALVREGVPFSAALDPRVEAIGAGTVRIRVPFKPALLRPGGTISGPVVMALADLAMYALIMSVRGRVDDAVTTHLATTFMRRPAQAALIAEGRLLKLGRRLAFGDVLFYSEGEPDPVAQSTVTYAVPGAQ